MEPTIIRIIRIALVLLALVLFIWFIVWLFSPKNTNDEATQPVDTPAQQEQLAAVRYVQDGEITAPEKHYSIAITITATSRHIDVYNGYDVGPTRSESYPNNQASYDAYYAALVNVGFFSTKENLTGADRNSYCPLGIRYSYQAGNDIAYPTVDSWSASCSAKAGTFAGSKTDVKTLFKKQIPDYTEITKGVTL